MGKNFGATLKSIHIVDGFVEAMPMSYENPTQTEDPFVMLAWKCPKLESLRILGKYLIKENGHLLGSELTRSRCRNGYNGCFVNGTA